MGTYRRGAIYTIHTDHLGTPRLITDRANKPLWQWAYSAFGANQPAGVLNTIMTADGHPVLRALEPVTEIHLRFAGQSRDAESGTFYNALRDSYDPFIGRYRQADPIGTAGSLNLFGYVSGSPLTRVDPLGLQATAVLGGLGGGASTAGTGAGLLGGAAGLAVVGAAVAGYAVGTALYPIIEQPLASIIDQCVPDHGERCEKAKQDARSAYGKLTTKRIPQYLSGGTNGQDMGHYNALL